MLGIAYWGVGGAKDGATAMSTQRDLEGSIRALEAQRGSLGNAVVDTAITALREKIHPSPASLGERKLVTIVFADISGFTRMSETRDPEEVRDLVTAAFDVLVPIIERYGGIVDKFIGDAVMALFGAKLAREDDARRALLAALDMRTAFGAFVQKSGLELGIHFGINSGTVVTGRVGASGSGAFSVMGDAVNLAARLEDLSEIGEILVGATTRDLAGDDFAFDARQPVPLKGKENPVPVFALLRREAATGARRLKAPLIGRAKESAALAEALTRVQSGDAAAICVVGEAGTGKSRLVAEARRTAPEGIGWLQVRSASHDQGIGFGALRMLVHALLHLRPDTSAEILVEALRVSVAMYFPPEEQEEAFELLALIAGIAEGTTASVANVASDLVERRLAGIFCRWIETLGDEQPLAIVWEDLHWADRSSLRVLGLMAREHLPRRSLQVLCFRPSPELLVGVATSGTAVIELDPLSRDDSVELFGALVQPGDLSEEVIATILARAEGNPFFLEEIIQSLIDSEAMIVDDGRIIATAKLNSQSIPSTLQGVLMARLDQLQPNEKQVLQTASVLGRIFEPPVLKGLLSNDDRVRAGLMAVLESLQTLDLIRRHEAIDAEEGRYKFKHALTQEVAYNSVLLVSRRKLHGAAANLLATLASQAVDAAPLIAWHFENSDQPQRAVPYLRVAAEASARAHASREAVAYYRRIAALAPVLSGEPEGAAAFGQASGAMGVLLQVTGRSASALEALDHALGLVTANDQLQRASLLRRSGLAWMTSREAERALELYEQAEVILSEVADNSTEWWNEWIELRLDRVWALTWMGKVREALHLMQDGRVAINEHGNLGQRVRLEDRILTARLFREAEHPTEEAISQGRATLAMAEEWGEPRVIAMANFTLGYGLTFKRELVGACAHLEEAVRISTHIGDVEYEVAARALHGIASRMAGNLEAVAAGAGATIEAARNAGMRSYVAIGLANRAWAELLNGNCELARTDAAEAAEIWTTELWRIGWLAHWPLLAIALLENDATSVRRHAKAMLSPMQYDMGPQVMEALRDGYDWALAGEDNLAMQAFRRGCEPARALGCI